MAFGAKEGPDEDYVLSALGLLQQLGATYLKGPVAQGTRSTGSIYHTWFCFSSRWEGARTYLALT